MEDKKVEKVSKPSKVRYLRLAHKVLNTPRFLRRNRIMFRRKGSSANQFKSVPELTLDCAPFGD